MANKKSKKTKTPYKFGGTDEPPIDAEERGAGEESVEEHNYYVKQPLEFQNPVDNPDFTLQGGMAYENFIRRIYPEGLDDVLQLTDMNPLLESYSSAALILADHLNRRAMPKSANVLYNTVENICKVRVSHRRQGRSEVVQMMSGTVLPPNSFAPQEEEQKKKWWARFFE